MKRSGYLLLLLHAHLPYVRHPEHERFSEERWLFEALTDCYLPLLSLFEGLSKRGVPHRFTLSLSPPLMAMLGDRLLQQRYRRHLSDLIDLVRREQVRHARNLGLRALADYYRGRLESTAERYEACDGDLLSSFGRLAAAGGIELITTAATHGYLPLLRGAASAVHAQLQVAADAYRETFGKPTPGIWLPECGYYPELDGELTLAGYHWFFLESHGITHARPRPPHGVQAPLACGPELAAFGRDPGCSRAVWSREQGYPGHPLYREYHRDLGNEPGDTDLGPLAGGPTGIKYHRITDRGGGEKALYDPQAAVAQALRHAGEFLDARSHAAGRSELRDRPPLFVAPFDAELFGHWWYEGPRWLEALAEQAASREGLQLISPSDYLARHPVLPRATPSQSSWGEGGYNRVWLNADNAWLIPHLHEAAGDMADLAARHAEGPVPMLQERALNQAARSLLLAQSSDWPFIMRTGTTVEYAVKRVTDHLSRFRYLTDAVRRDAVDERRLAALERMDAIFPKLDFRVYAGP
jgi:1,4-alpha-glucan branching enzyme